MQTAAHLDATIDALEEIAAARGPADVVLSRYFRARRYIGSKDRAMIAENVYRILRHTARYAWWAQKTAMPDTPRSHALADQMLCMRLPLAQLHNLCDGEQYSPDKISTAEHAGLKQLSDLPMEPDDMPEHVALECPEEFLPAIKEAYGERYVAVLRALQNAAPLDARVNTLKADVDTLFAQLKEAKFNIEKGRYAPACIRLNGRPNLNAHPAFSTGLVEVQDEGSQILSTLVDAQPGMRVFDFCAGAGGKTLALAAAMKNKGRIIATDISNTRLQKAKLRFRRADVQNVEINAIESENDVWLKRHKDSFDRVLVDAPCSGTGTWRRNPEMRWKEGGVGLEELLRLQKSILAAAARLVKPGGRLIYATCSMLPNENEKVVNEFLTENPLFSGMHMESLWEHVGLAIPYPVTSTPYIRLNPADHGTDGFFAAVLERKAS